MGPFEVTALMKAKSIWQYSEDELDTIYGYGDVLKAVQNLSFLCSINIRPEHYGYDMSCYWCKDEVIKSFRIVEDFD